MTDMTESTTTEMTVEAPVDGAPVAVEAQDATAAVVEPAADDDGATALGGAPEADAAAEVVEAPDIPEAYELTMPEGLSVDADLLAEATPVFKELGLTNETASKLMPFAGKLIEKASEATMAQLAESGAAQRKAWLDEAKASEDIGGGKWDATIGAAAKGLDALGYKTGTPFRAFLNESGIGNHPDMIRIAAKLGELVSEDGEFVRADAGAPALPTWKRLYPND